MIVTNWSLGKSRSLCFLNDDLSSSNKPEDVWAARMNDNFKTNYALEMYCFGEYPGYYQEYLTKCGIYPETQPEDQSNFEKPLNQILSLLILSDVSR